MNIFLKNLTQKNIKSAFIYDPETGFFHQKGKTMFRPAGARVGCFDERGYWRIKIGGRLVRAHRLAWLYVYGYLPETDIDHINKNKSDNRIKNLRVVSRSCNMRNVGNKKSNKSGVNGVYWSSQKKKWAAQIKTNYQIKYLGHYKHKHNAVCARLAAEQCLGWSGCDATSPAYLYVRKMLAKANA